MLRILEKMFPIQRHEWPKALLLLAISTLLGVGFSISRASSEALFLTRFGVEYLPYLQLVNPILALIATTIYGVYASRIPHDRLLAYTVLLSIPIILVMRLLMGFDFGWVYFLLFAFVLAYAAVLATSWSIYLPGHYDVQESKRLIPFISSGTLIGTVLGGVGVAFSVPLIGAGNVLFLWIATLVGVVLLIYSMSRLFTSMDTAVRKVTKKPTGKQAGVLQSLQEGLTYSRTSALFMTTAVSTIATMMALQLIDFEYSKIFRKQYPSAAELTAFLGVVDGLTTVLALLIQWFVVPRCIRNFGVQGTNLLFPYSLMIAFGGLLMAPMLGPAIFARFSRYSLMPSLRGTTRTLMLNAVPRKTGALVRSFNTGIVLPVGQIAGALLLVSLKGFSIPILFPVLGFIISGAYLYYSYRQNAAYGEALLDLLREDKIHLLDLDDDEIRQLDAQAVEAISSRLHHEQEDISLAAVELLRSIGSAPASEALQRHLPFPSATVTAAALQAIAEMHSASATLLRPYLDDAHPQVRLAALAGLRHLGDAALTQRAASLLDDADVHVQAAALALILPDRQHPAYERAYRQWQAMLETSETATLIAALEVLITVPESALQGRLYRALDHPDSAVRYAALDVLMHLAEAGRITRVDSALLHTLEAEDVELRYRALRVLAALNSDEALEQMLVLLDDEQPRIREALGNALKRFGKRAMEPLFQRLRSPQTSLPAKESALLALARLDGVQAEQFLAFWEGELHDVYRYKLILACMEQQSSQEADTFLRVALQNAQSQTLSLLVQLLSVWTSPEVARLVESGLHDTDRNKRASALEALESLSDRRFTRLLLPILDAEESQNAAWKEVAERQWHLHIPDMASVIEHCLHSTNKWIVIGALLAQHARSLDEEPRWTETLQQLAATTTDLDVRRTALRLAGKDKTEPHGTLSLTDVMLFLKRIPLYSSMTLGQLHTMATHLTEKEVQAGEVIFQEGDDSHELYLIATGKVHIVQQRGNPVRILATLEEGGFFGDMAIFEERPRSAGAIAAESGVLLVLSPEHFRQIIMQEPAISFEIFRELSARLRRFDASVAAASS